MRQGQMDRVLVDLVDPLQAALTEGQEPAVGALPLIRRRRQPQQP